MLLWDAHLDLGLDALNANRNLLEPVEAIRMKERQRPGCTPVGWSGAGEGTVAFPEMRLGRVAVTFATVLAGVGKDPNPHIDFQTEFQAYGMARGHLAYYKALEKQGLVRIITDLQQLDHHIEEWRDWEAQDSGKEEAPPFGFILNIEGADPILTPSDLDEWHQLGLRVIMLGHFGAGRYTGGTGTDLPLNEQGRKLLSAADRLRMIFDMNHLSDLAFWQALDLFKGPVIASHSNARSLVPGQRQLSDDQIKALISREGVIGICADVWMLEPDWVAGVGTNAHVTLETMIDHIDYVCQLAGDSRHVGIGTDLDGGYGCSQCPNDLDSIADLQQLAGLLLKRAYTAEDIANIFYCNFLNLVRNSWS